MVDTSDAKLLDPETKSMEERPTVTINLRGFFLRLFLFLLPFAVVFMALTGGLIYVGESMPINMVLAHQQGDETALYRTRYGNRDMAYKQAAVNQHAAEVLIMGSSRMLQFRAGFLTETPDAFYNGAAPAWTLDEIQWLIQKIDDDALPRVLILGIDPPWFNENYVADDILRPTSDWSFLFEVNRSFVQDLIDGANFNTDYETFDVARYLERRVGGYQDTMALGLRAIRDGQGFRNDGSELFGDFLVGRWIWQPQMRANHLELMQRGEDVYPFGNAVAEDRVAVIEEIIAFAQEHDILLVGVLPPYAPSMWQALMANPQQSYIPQVTTAMQDLFDAAGFPLLDYSDGAWLDTTDEDFFDGWHASERTSLYMFADIVQHVPDLQAYSDVEALLIIAQSAQDTWHVFE